MSFHKFFCNTAFAVSGKFPLASVGLEFHCTVNYICEVSFESTKIFGKGLKGR